MSEKVRWVPKDEATIRKYEAMKSNSIRPQDLDRDLHKVVHYAANRNDVDFLMKLIPFHRKKTSEDETIRLLNHPFGHNCSTAIMNSASGVTKYLLDQKADPNTMNFAGWGNTAYHWAAWDANLEKLQILLEHNPLGVHAFNKKGETPLKVIRFLRTQDDAALTHRAKLLSRMGCMDSALEGIIQQMEDALNEAEEKIRRIQQNHTIHSGSSSMAVRDEAAVPETVQQGLAVAPQDPEPEEDFLLRPAWQGWNP